MPADKELERFVALVRREMRADDVRVLPMSAEPPDAPNVVTGRLNEGQQIVVVFAEPPPDRDARLRRLEMLTGTFAQSLGEAKAPRRSRPPATRSLQDELRALAQRARAADARVIDAHSPVVWGSAHPSVEPPDRDASAVDLATVSRRGVLAVAPSPGPAGPAQDREPPPSAESSGPALPEKDELEALAARVIDRVREHEAIATLPKGGRLHETVREADLGYLAHSFASIYVLVLVFPAPFDELRAERALADALPRIERLVLSLPPLDPRPAPMAGVLTFRARSRRSR